MLELRRIRAGIFKEDDEKYPSISLYEIEKIIKDEKELRKSIIPGEVISKLYPVVQIEEESAERILSGQPVYEKNLDKKYEFKKGHD